MTDRFDHYADRFDNWADKNGLTPYIDRFLDWAEKPTSTRLLDDWFVFSVYLFSIRSYRKRLRKLGLSTRDAKVATMILASLVSLGLRQQQILRAQREFQKSLDKLKLQARKKGVN